MPRILTFSDFKRYIRYIKKLDVSCFILFHYLCHQTIISK
jgi:hypothetical protein